VVTEWLTYPNPDEFSRNLIEQAAIARRAYCLLTHQSGKEGSVMKIMHLMVAVVLLAGTAFAGEPRFKPGAHVYIENGQTVDSSNARDKASYGDFGLVLTSALQKKQVPVVIVTDPEKAEYTIRHTSSMSQESSGTRIAKMAFGFGMGGRGGIFEGSVDVIDKESTAVVFSFTTKKGKAQSGAENFANKFKEQFEK